MSLFLQHGENLEQERSRNSVALVQDRKRLTEKLGVNAMQRSCCRLSVRFRTGSDIMMQLDDVVSSTVTGPRVEEAMRRSVRWLDRCISANKNPHRQNLFAIIQGGLNAELRRACLDGESFCRLFIQHSEFISKHIRENSLAGFGLFIFFH